MAQRPAWYKPDTQLGIRMLGTVLLLLAVYTFFVIFLWRITNGNLIIFVLFALILSGIQYFFSDKIALMSMGAHEVAPGQEPQLYSMIERLAQQSNLPTPKLYIADTNIPNAFATGRDPKHSAICVTSGIRYRLNDQELEAVLAHEMTHIINRDTLVMTMAMFFAMVAQLLMRSLFFSMLFGGGGGFGGRRRGNDSGAAAILIAYAVSALVYGISFVLIRTLSRYREYAADRGSALITGAPGNLASALMKITDSIQGGRIPEKDLRDAQGASALFIAPLAVNGGDGLSELLSTHPSTQHRIAKLMEMQAQMEKAPRVH